MTVPPVLSSFEVEMKIIDIIGEDYSGPYVRTRIGCRCFIRRGGSLLMSYEALTDTWMIPGGGREAGENDADCCKREVAEETGTVVQTTDCLLEVDEYYGDVRYINRYFGGTVVGSTERRLTEEEKRAGMEPRWIKTEDIVRIFSRFGEYEGKDEMKRGMYQREHTALCEFLSLEKP